jgi:dipeptidyl aminopeptidase/acylaminoacyl peptidase
LKTSLFASFCLLLNLLSSAQVRQIPLRDFFRKPDKTEYQISPGGNFLSYKAMYKNRLNLFVQKTDQRDSQRITSISDRDISDYFWKNDNTIFFFKDKDGDEDFHLYKADLKPWKIVDCTPFKNTRVELISDLPDDPDHVIIEMNKRDAEVFDPYLLNIKTGKMKMIVRNPGNISTWFTDHAGKIRLALRSEGLNTTLLYRETEKDSFREVISTSFKETLMPVIFTFDNKKLYCISSLGRDKEAIVVFDPITAKETEVVYENPDVDVDELDYSPKEKQLTFATYVTDKTKYEFLDKGWAAMYFNVSHRLGNYILDFCAFDKNEDKYIVKTISDRTLGAYYLYDAHTNALNKLAEINPSLKESEMCEMKPVSYTSRDGLMINGYLTLPQGMSPHNLPVIINPHGGPWERNTWKFNKQVQFLANRGYAVFQMNFRGSTGYGKKFNQAGFKQWGRAMQDDITDGVQWLIREGIADPKRIAIYGGSYGGYAALAGITFTPDLYACGVDYCGISNLFTDLKTEPAYWKIESAAEYEMVGNPIKDSALFYSISPVFHADLIKCPLLVIQGKNDPRVNKAESDQIVEALRKRGMPVEYILKDNEGHGFENQENIFEIYEAMERFFGKYLR